MSLSPNLFLFSMDRAEVLEMFREKLKSGEALIEKLQARWEVEPMGAVREDMKEAIGEVKKGMETLTFMRDHLRKDGWPQQVSAMHLLEIKSALRPFDAKEILGESNLIASPAKAVQDFQHNIQGRPPRW